MSRAAAMTAHAEAEADERILPLRSVPSAAAAPVTPRQIEALTTLRFFAALFVVVFHHGQPQFASAPGWIQNVVKGGFIGVPFFFILSGFILAYTYLPQVEARTFAPRRFWLARLARIYPVYAAALLLSAPLALLGLQRAMGWEAGLRQFGLQAAACFGLVQAWIPEWSFAWNGPAWSLSVEACFYLLFPWLVTRLNGRTRGSLLGGLLLIAAALAGLGWLVPAWNVIPRLQALLGWANPLLWLPLFLLGISAADWQRQRSATQPNASGARAAILTTGVVAVMVTALALNWQRHSQLLFCYGLALPCALLIVLLADSRNSLGRWLAGRGLVRLGEASFALYILHRPVAEWLRWLRGGAREAGFETAIGFTGYVVLCLGLSLAALQFLELPCRQWIKRGGRGSRAPAPGLRPGSDTISILP